MASKAGRNARVKVSGAPLTLTDEATTASSDRVTFTITNTAKRILDRTAAVTVKEDGVTTAAAYRVNRLTGQIVFEDPSPCFTSIGVGDTSAWSTTGTPTRSAAAFTCSDGIALDLVGDDSASAAEYYTDTVRFTGDGTKDVRFRVARSSAYSGHVIVINDATAGGALRLAVHIDFTSATPSVAVSPGEGTLKLVTDRGDGSFEILASTTSAVVAANTNVLGVIPAINASADTAAFYVGYIRAYDTVSGPRGVGVAVTVSASYLPCSVAAKIRNYSYSLTAKNEDDSDFESGDYVTRTQTLKDVTGSLSGKWESSGYFRDALLAGDPVVIEFFPDKTGAADLVCWALLDKNGLDAAVDGLVEASVDFQGTTDADGRAFSAA